MKNEIIISTITTADNKVYNITQDAMFPAIPITATIDNLESGDKLVRVWSEQLITFKEYGRNDSLNAEGELKKQAQKQEVPIVLNEVRGGKLDVVCKATIDPRAGNNFTITSKVLHFIITGTQPIKDNVRKILGNPYLSAVVYFKSKFIQFTSDGRPVFDQGWGLFRIEKPKASEIWNWKENAAYARADFETRKKKLAEYPSQLRTTNPTEYKDLPDFNEKQLELETLQSYGSRMYHVPKRAGISRKWLWVKNTEDDGFAEKCLAILEQVSQGKFPEGWN